MIGKYEKKITVYATDKYKNNWFLGYSDENW